LTGSLFTTGFKTGHRHAAGEQNNPWREGLVVRRDGGQINKPGVIAIFMNMFRLSRRQAPPLSPV